MDGVVAGTLAGHLYFGALFTAWACFWLVESVVYRAEDEPGGLERGRILPAMKIVLPLVAIWFEIPNRGWEPMDYMMGWAHIAAYLPFALTGLVDFAAQRGAIDSRAGFVAYAMAMVNAAFVFWGHDAHTGVATAGHHLLEIALIGAAGAGLWEYARPGALAGAFRRGSLLGLGTWLLILTWVLYRSGWDMTDPLRESWLYVLFSWNAIIVALAVFAVAWIAARAPAAAPAAPSSA